MYVIIVELNSFNDKIKSSEKGGDEKYLKNTIFYLVYTTIKWCIQFDRLQLLKETCFVINKVYLFDERHRSENANIG